MEIILPLLNLLQISLSTYTLYHTAISIRNLQGYESSAKKAARYSSTAAEQLRTTRTTQAAAALSILLNLLSSLSLLFHTSSSRTTTQLILPILNTLILEASRRHIQSFWSGKMRVPLPGTGDYNEAMEKTQGVVLDGMLWLEVSWVGVGILRILL